MNIFDNISDETIHLHFVDYLRHRVGLHQCDIMYVNSNHETDIVHISRYSNNTKDVNNHDHLQSRQHTIDDGESFEFNQDDKTANVSVMDELFLSIDFSSTIPKCDWRSNAGQRESYLFIDFRGVVVWTIIMSVECQ